MPRSLTLHLIAPLAALVVAAACRDEPAPPQPEPEPVSEPAPEPEPDPAPPGAAAATETAAEQAPTADAVAERSEEPAPEEPAPEEPVPLAVEVVPPPSEVGLIERIGVDRGVGGMRPTFSADGEVLAFVGLPDPRRIHLASGSDGAPTRELAVVDADASFRPWLALSSGGRRLAVFASEHRGALVRVAAPASDPVALPPSRDALFTPDGTLVLLTDDALVALGVDGEERARLEAGGLDEAVAISLAEDVVYVRWAEEVRAASLPSLSWSGEARPFPNGQLERVRGHFAALSTHGIQLVDLRDGSTRAIEENKGLDFYRAIPFPARDGRAAFTFQTHGNAVETWFEWSRVAPGDEDLTLLARGDNPLPSTSVALSDDDSRAALVNVRGVAVVRSTSAEDNAAQLAALEGAAGQPDPTGARLMTVGLDAVELLELATHERSRIPLPTDIAYPVARFTPDGARVLVVGMQDAGFEKARRGFAWIDVARGTIGRSRGLSYTVGGQQRGVEDFKDIRNSDLFYDIEVIGDALAVDTGDALVELVPGGGVRRVHSADAGAHARGAERTDGGTPKPSCVSEEDNGLEVTLPGTASKTTISFEGVHMPDDCRNLDWRVVAPRDAGWAFVLGTTRYDEGASWLIPRGPDVRDPGAAAHLWSPVRGAATTAFATADGRLLATGVGVVALWDPEKVLAAR